MADVTVKENKQGFWEIEPKPDSETLARYYREKYYAAGDGHNQFSFAYTPEELEHKYLDAAEAQEIVGAQPKSMLEVGCGEGFFLEHFSRLGWDAKGLDFTSDGINAFFPHLAPRVKIGDAFALLNAEATAGNQFDLLVCNNVLEHVIDPNELLQLFKKVLKKGGVLRLAVPNDFSWLQKLLIARNDTPDNFWVCPPDHLNYFNVESIQSLLREHRWDVIDVLCTFPIDIFLLNPDSNYIRERPKGRACHFARVAFEIALWRQGIDKVIAFRRGCGASLVGRDITVYAKAM
jgi:2-polyprenyl-3-methyl-5-hydroxy-6-metoxy-1,4-benzoquinol methylase